MDLHSGMYVSANVCLVRQLGEGGMGSVWVADHLSLNTRVAVKFVSAELVKTDPTIIERFKREAALCAQIKSPHVVQTFDHGVMADGRPYIVMELLEGESLQDRIERTGPLSLAETKAVINQTCKALGRAHKLGIVHRDIKPDNLFLTPDEDEPFLLKVLDFGIAKQTGLPQVSKMTSTGSMVGTPEYMSPEQVLSGNSIDFRSDLWAIAVVAYHCLTAMVPFQAETLGSLCVAIAHARFRPARELRPELLPAVDRWFSRALAVDPKDRHASSRELAQTFAYALSPNETIDDFTTGDGVAALAATIGATPEESSRRSAAGGAAPEIVHGMAPRTPSPTAMSATVLGPSPKGGMGRTVGVVAATLALGGAGAYFFYAAPPRDTAAANAADVASSGEAAQSSPSTPTAATAPPVPTTEPALAVPSAEASASAAVAPSLAPRPARAPSPATGQGTTAPARSTTTGPVDRGF
jgi:serine/threonine protein kinase